MQILLKLKFSSFKPMWPYPILVSCQDPLVFFPKKFMLFCFHIFGFERTRWWLFKKRAMRTTSDIYIFITGVYI